MQNTQDNERSSTKLPTIQQIRREHHLTSRVVAERASVDFQTEYLLEIGGFVDRNDALKVLEALSTLTGEQYTLENVGGLCVSTPPLKEERNSKYS